MKYKLYTWGYSGGHTPAELQKMAKKLGAIVVDIRYSPRSRVAKWNHSALHLTIKPYKWLQALGNQNYRGGPMKIVDMSTGMREIGEMLEKQNVIIMCSCEDVDHCHRLPVSREAHKRLGVEVIHLDGIEDLDHKPEAPGEQAALF